MNRENLFEEYHRRSNCEGPQNSKIQPKLISFFSKFLKSRRFHNLEMLQTSGYSNKN